jgi:thiol-disulfide isomerase/thioredoxin
MLKFLNMKKSVIFSLFCLFSIGFTSCSDTVVVQSIPDGSVTAPPVSGYFKKRVLIEDYTGTWCGNCTRVAHAIDLVLEQTDKVVPVGIHLGNDPYDFTPSIGPLKNLISPNFDLELPVSRLNRLNTWTFPETINTQEAIDLTGNNSGLGLAMSSQIGNASINLDVKINFAQDDYSNLKLVVYLVEDNLIYNQANYTTYYGNVHPVVGYVHNHVLRKSITDILGNPITENIAVNHVITKNFTFVIPSNIANESNIGFVAFIVGSDNKVINVRASHANETQTFEQNP